MLRTHVGCESRISEGFKFADDAVEGLSLDVVGNHEDPAAIRAGPSSEQGTFYELQFSLVAHAFIVANSATGSTLEFLASLISGSVGWQLLGFALFCDCLNQILCKLASGFMLFPCCFSLQLEFCGFDCCWASF